MELRKPKQYKEGRMRLHWWTPRTSQSSPATNEYVESLDIGSIHRIQTLKKFPCKCLKPQLTNSWSVTEEVLYNFQPLLISTYSAIFRLESETDSCRRPKNLEINEHSKLSAPYKYDLKLLVLQATLSSILVLWRLCIKWSSRIFKERVSLIRYFL